MSSISKGKYFVHQNLFCLPQTVDVRYSHAVAGHSTRQLISIYSLFYFGIQTLKLLNMYYSMPYRLASSQLL